MAHQPPHFVKHVGQIISKAKKKRRVKRNPAMNRKQQLKMKQVTYTVGVAVEGVEGFIASFQEILTLLSPINAGGFECKDRMGKNNKR